MKLSFDRGTVLLTDPPKDLDLAQAPGVLWDPRVRAYRAPASRYPALKRWLLDGGARFNDIPSPPRSMQEAWAPIDLRPYQEAALSAWELSHRRGVVALPTGSGKTRLALAAMQRTGLSALCLVPTRVLLEQWLREISLVYGSTVGCYGDGVRQLTPLTVATFESAYRHMDQIGDRFDLLIVDEVHHFGGGLRDEALEMAIAGARLGLTATPPRDTGAAARLGELVGPTVFELAVADLAGGFLASFDAITLYLDLSRGAFRLRKLECGLQRHLPGIPSGGAGGQLGGLHPTRRPHPRRPARPGGLAPDATASGLHTRQAPYPALAAGAPPTFQGPDLHGRQRYSVRDRARAPCHASHLRYRPARA